MFTFLSGTIESEPGRFVGPLARALGWVFNLIFELFNNDVTIGVALGLSIIVITFLMRTLILPLGIKSHKSMMKMQRIAPDANAIKKKYEGKTDPELKRKMHMEIQELYRKNNVNPLMGCLPALATMPVFIGLNFIFRNVFMYVNHIRDIYYDIAAQLITLIPPGVPGSRIPENFTFWYSEIRPMLSSGDLIEPSSAESLSRAVASFTSDQWDAIREQITYLGGSYAELNAMLAERSTVETFLWWDMIGNSGWAFPGILIPLLAVATMVCSTLLMQRANKTADAAQKTQQKIMLIVMPLFFGFITIIMPLGVGFYWVMSNIYQIGQHYVLQQYYKNKPL